MSEKRGRKPIIDSPEQRQKCLSCTLPECINCLFYGDGKGGRSLKYRKEYEFFGEMLTHKQIADRIGASYRAVYGWYRSGGMENVERRARKRGYEP